ncbi:MAG: hypothetical protein U0Q18_19675 [Bryobacteraceae bacterium]
MRFISSLSHIASILVCLIWPILLQAQRITIGIEAGAPITRTFDTGFIYKGTFLPATDHYTVGPALDLHLVGSFHLFMNALYQPYSFQQSYYLGTPADSKTTGSLWQVPVLLRYRILRGPLHPFVSLGPSFQLAANITQRYQSLLDSAPSITHPSPSRRVVAGVAAGAGVELSIRRLHLLPEIRYTRWGAENYDFSQTSHVGTNLNQLQLLVGLAF